MLTSIPISSLRRSSIAAAACGLLGLALAGSGCGQAGGGGPIEVAITGEEAVRQGLQFTPTPQPDQLVFVDGWTLRFERWLTVVGAVRLNQPGRDPAQQQLVGGAVATRTGPWVVDLTQADTIPLTRFERADDGGGFDTTTRYAFSFDLAPAQASVTRVNLDGADEAALALMIQRGYSNYAEVVATHAPFATGDDPSFQSYPTTVRFNLGWGGTVSYLNCENPDNGTDGQASRGVQPRQDTSRSANIHMHIEHPFWEALNTENPPLRFDAIAARATTQLMGSERVGTVNMDDLDAAIVSRLTDTAGSPVMDRCATAGCQRKSGALAYSPMGASGVETLKKFVIYSAQAMAHLNGEGLCYVERK